MFSGGYRKGALGTNKLIYLYELQMRLGTSNQMQRELICKYCQVSMKQINC